MNDLPKVVSWRKQDDGTFRKVGQVAAFSALSFTPTYQDVGTGTVATRERSALTTLLPNRYLTIEWRGTRTTWVIQNFTASEGEDANPSLLWTATLQGAAGILGRERCWPDATKAIEVQPIWRLKDPAPYIGPAETILRKLIAENFRDRRGEPLVIPATQGRGETIRVRPVFDNLFELVQRYAKKGGIGFDIGLEDDSPVTARLTLRFWVPDDLSKRVKLTTGGGAGDNLTMKTVASWNDNSTEPSATQVIVGTGDDKAQRTTLTADISPTDNTITVGSSADFPSPDKSTPPFRVVIDSESLQVTHVSGKTWTVQRGIGATTAAHHDNGDRVSLARAYRVVDTDASKRAATTWGGHRVSYLDGPSTKDVDEIIDSGRAALSDGAESRALSVTSTEPTGMRVFTHYQIGDVVTVQVATDPTAVTAPVSAAEINVDQDSGVTVNPIFGDPGKINSRLATSTLLRGLRRGVDYLQRKG